MREIGKRKRLMVWRVEERSDRKDLSEVEVGKRSFFITLPFWLKTTRRVLVAPMSIARYIYSL